MIAPAKPTSVKKMSLEQLHAEIREHRQVPYTPMPKGPTSGPAYQAWRTLQETRSNRLSNLEMEIATRGACVEKPTLALPTPKARGRRAAS